MNKKTLYGMIALLSAALLFFGCDTGTSSDSNTVTPPNWPTDPSGGGTSPGSTAQAALALATALGGDAVAYASANGTVTLRSGVNLSTPTNVAAIEIPAGVTLSIPAGSSLTIGNAATQLAINGTLNVAGGFTITGGVLTNEGTIIANANITTPAGGNVVNNGVITVDTGKAFATGTGGNLTNNGTINGPGNLTVDGDLTNNGPITGITTVDVNGALTNNGNKTINVAEDLDVEGNLVNHGTITGPGDVIVNAGSFTNDGTLNTTGDITVTTGSFTNGAGGNVTVVSTKKLEVTDAAGVFTNNGTLTIMGTVDVVAGDFENTSNITISGVTVLGADILGTLKTQVTTGKDVENSGTITVDANGVVEFGVATTFTAPGKTIVKTGGTLTDSAAGLTVGDTKKLTLGPDTIFSYDVDSFDVVAGVVTVAAAAWSFDVDNRKLNVGAGGKLIIPSGNVLTVTDGAGAGTGPGILGVSGASVEVGATTSLVGAGVVSTNFYAADGSTPLATIAAKTYTWEANAGTTTGAGWEHPIP
jgi:filamentous hemagglutinin